MKKFSLFGFCLILITPLYVAGQVTAYPPVPVAEKDMREGSIKLRSVELERVKRDANKIRRPETEKARKERFALIKKDFEGIQKTQDQIIKTYITGKTINYSRIGKLALQLNGDALRLNENLFTSGEDKSISESKSKPKYLRQNEVKDLIVELDRAIGQFTKSPIFKNLNLVDSEASKIAQLELKKIIGVSRSLTEASEIMASK